MPCPACGGESRSDAPLCDICDANLVVPDDAPPRPFQSRSSSGFVGRQQEMGELTAALEESLSGRGRLAMLVGDPGIGKTRTAQELAARAQTMGANVLWGRCYEEEGSPPYWPWLQSLRPVKIVQDQQQGLSPSGILQKSGYG